MGTRWKIFKATWRGWREYKRSKKKEVKKMKSIFRSKTTRNVGVAAATGIPSAVGFIAFLRSILGEKLPWSVEGDKHVAWLVGVLLIPLFSRLMAWVVDKKRGSFISREASGKSLLSILLIVSCMSVTGCVATRFYEKVGDVETEYTAKSVAWPFSKIDATTHQMKYKWDGDEDKPSSQQNEIKVGQEAAGIDNTGMAVLGPLLEKFLDALDRAYKPVTSPVETKPFSVP